MRLEMCLKGQKLTMNGFVTIKIGFRAKKITMGKGKHYIITK